VVKRSGIAYLEGFDALADVGDLGSSLGVQAAPVTQPLRVGLVDMRNPLRSGPSYTDVIAPLLAAMDTTLAALATRGETIAATVPEEAMDLALDLRDASRMTALRAAQVHGLYDYVSGWPFGDPSVRRARLSAARTALDAAAAIVKTRESHYRVPAERIAGWRENPTAYEFTYLWPVRSLYFWWRDEGKAVDAPASPCYLNIMSPADVGLGEGIVQDAAQAIKNAVGGAATECLSAPASAPIFPQDGLRTRP
jgi:hypothetical protein